MTETDTKHHYSRGVLPAMLLGLLILFSHASPAMAQIQQRMGFQPGQVNVPGYYDLTRPGQDAVNINIWGAVRTAGYYVVPAGTDLSQMLSFSGGPSTLGERRRDRRPDITVSISRAMSEGRKIVYIADFNYLINEAQIYPILEDGDIIILEGEPLPRRWEARDYLSLVSATVSVLLLVDRFIYPIARN
ncbi:MAG: hypothetical protein EA364_13535 [Balneolaceae bacterium]|nr:MAG: hypothetical protein EA364_13535 [Balneolaceae bacterium]